MSSDHLCRFKLGIMYYTLSFFYCQAKISLLQKTAVKYIGQSRCLFTDIPRHNLVLHGKFRSAALLVVCNTAVEIFTAVPDDVVVLVKIIYIRTFGNTAAKIELSLLLGGNAVFNALIIAEAAKLFIRLGISNAKILASPEKVCAVIYWVAYRMIPEKLSAVAIVYDLRLHGFQISAADFKEHIFLVHGVWLIRVFGYCQLKKLTEGKLIVAVVLDIINGEKRSRIIIDRLIFIILLKLLVEIFHHAKIVFVLAVKVKVVLYIGDHGRSIVERVSEIALGIFGSIFVYVLYALFLLIIIAFRIWIGKFEHIVTA